ncbi:hypothetical protein B0H17DRAFT_1140099 [Mycena rosella]|uniref:Uncharacterized protein n=1 Tax=Mycena rosella TaxID=1033263 RepID=A0AAD7D336_MYCRO|nr:hypothetical protein B0H17DRAFT_1140099 [Mycena rosella]
MAPNTARNGKDNKLPAQERAIIVSWVGPSSDTIFYKISASQVQQAMRTIGSIDYHISPKSDINSEFGLVMPLQPDAAGKNKVLGRQLIGVLSGVPIHPQDVPSLNSFGLMHQDVVKLHCVKSAASHGLSEVHAHDHDATHSCNPINLCFLLKSCLQDKTQDKLEARLGPLSERAGL